MEMRISFSTLGGVRLEVDGAEVRIRGRRERAVLALLLAARRQVIPVDRLIEDIWGDDATAAHGVRRSPQLTRALVEPAGSAWRRTRGAGDDGPHACLLWLRVHAGRSVRRQNAPTRRSTGRADEALRLCDEAAGLWAGPPFGEAPDGDLIRAETARLEDLRLQAHELRSQGLLELGRHGLVTGELESLVLAHPFRERLWSYSSRLTQALRPAGTRCRRCAAADD